MKIDRMHRKELDLIVGNAEKSKLFNIVEQYIDSKIKNQSITNINDEKEFDDFGI